MHEIQDCSPRGVPPRRVGFHGKPVAQTAGGQTDCLLTSATLSAADRCRQRHTCLVPAWRRIVLRPRVTDAANGSAHATPTEAPDPWLARCWASSLARP